MPGLAHLLISPSGGMGRGGEPARRQQHQHRLFLGTGARLSITSSAVTFASLPLWSHNLRRLSPSLSHCLGGKEQKGERWLQPASPPLPAGKPLAEDRKWLPSFPSIRARRVDPTAAGTQPHAQASPSGALLKHFYTSTPTVAEPELNSLAPGRWRVVPRERGRGDTGAHPERNRDPAAQEQKQAPCQSLPGSQFSQTGIPPLWPSCFTPFLPTTGPPCRRPAITEDFGAGRGRTGLLAAGQGRERS